MVSDAAGKLGDSVESVDSVDSESFPDVASLMVQRGEGGTSAQKARDIIEGQLERAARTVASLMERPGRNAMVQLAAARDILDRGGLMAEQTPAGGTNIQLVVVQAGAPGIETGKALDITALVKK